MVNFSKQSAAADCFFGQGNPLLHAESSLVFEIIENLTYFSVLLSY